MLSSACFVLDDNIQREQKHRFVRKPSNMEKLSDILKGISGEYFVAAELSRQGNIASLTLGNTKVVDILASNQDASKSVGIQVKTKDAKKKSWLLGKKAENHFKEGLFYVFVNLKEKDKRPDFHIVPSKTVANYVRESHKKWLKTPGKKGQPHQDNPLRTFEDKDNQYLERWESLGL
jgi:hypothetical protein